MFCHLHLHNEYSLLDGVGTSEKYAVLAREMGQTHLALTNHGNIDGAIKHQKQCKKIGIKPLIGCELYVVHNSSVKEKGEKRYHMVVLVENQTGWKNLLKMLSIANLEGFYYRPRVDLKTVLEHLEGLVILTGCSATFLNMGDSAEVFLQNAISKIGKDKIFLEVQPHKFELQIDVNNKILELKERYGLKLVATNDCHYPDAKSSLYQEVLLAIQSRKLMSDPTRWKFSVDGLYLKSQEEMSLAFRRQRNLSINEIKEALANTEVVAKICETFEIQEQQPSLPSIDCRPFETDSQLISNLIEKGFKSRLKLTSLKEVGVYRKRIEEELRLIKKMGFEKYFLVVWDLISWCRNNGIMTGPGRGSVGGSLVAYLMEITDVDPITYDLVFSRFISEDRIDLPDIDMDFEDHKRHLVKEYLSKKYGEYNVAGLSTFLTMKGKGVFRDVSRTYGIPLAEVNSVAKNIDITVENNLQIKESFSTISECIRFKEKYPLVIETAEALEGQIRGVGQHAAAVCVSSIDLRNGRNCNLAMRSSQIVANWDKTVAEFMGLIKLDVLGLSALSVLNETKAMVLKNHKKEIYFDKIALDDPKVYAEINKGNTVGAFQIGAPGLSKFCQNLKIDSFELLIAATALFRPGPLHSGMAEKFSKIKNGKEKVQKINGVYDEITKNTYGIIVYQEQVMSVINKLSGLDMSSCDKIRKLMAKSKGEEAINEYQKRFLDGCFESKTVTAKTAQVIWNTILTFGKYGFNKAHSVEYSLISYWDMWLKVYYPYEFIACCLTYGSKEQFKEYLKEAYKLKLSPRLPKVGIAHAENWTVDTYGNLFAPFISITGIGETSAKIISDFDPNKEKKKGFFKAKDLGVREAVPGINKKTCDILKKINAFSPIGAVTKEERLLINEILS